MRALGSKLRGGAARAFATVSPLGRIVLGAGFVAWLAGWQLGWDELMLLAASCFLAVAFGLALTIGRASLEGTAEIEPPRVVVGEAAVGRVEVANAGGRRSFGVPIEVAVGAGVARFEMPPLAPGGRWDDLFVVPTNRRCVIPIGPTRAVRGDPLGLVRRSVDLSGSVVFYVHPVTVVLTGMTAGWIRDLEGRTTNDMSTSDVAFHTLREYVPGDDRRHVHWRTSARVGKLMVRQFVDTRRSHLALVLSTNPADYADPEEFELAVSIVGSLGVSALADGQEVTVVSGGRPLPAHATTRLLDGLAGVELDPALETLQVLVRQALPIVRGASVVALVCGSGAGRERLRAACERFHRDARVLAMRAIPGTAPSLQIAGHTTVLDLGALDELARLMRSTVSR